MLIDAASRLLYWLRLFENVGVTKHSFLGNGVCPQVLSAVEIFKLHDAHFGCKPECARALLISSHLNLFLRG